MNIFYYLPLVNYIGTDEHTYVHIYAYYNNNMYICTLDLLDHVVDVDVADHFFDHRTRFVGVGHRRRVYRDRATVVRGRRHHRVARQRITSGASHNIRGACPAFAAILY